MWVLEAGVVRMWVGGDALLRTKQTRNINPYWHARAQVEPYYSDTNINNNIPQGQTSDWSPAVSHTVPREAAAAVNIVSIAN